MSEIVDVATSYCFATQGAAVDHLAEKASEVFHKMELGSEFKANEDILQAHGIRELSHQEGNLRTEVADLLEQCLGMKGRLKQQQHH